MNICDLRSARCCCCAVVLFGACLLSGRIQCTPRAKHDPPSDASPTSRQSLQYRRQSLRRTGTLQEMIQLAIQRAPRSSLHLVEELLWHRLFCVASRVENLGRVADDWCLCGRPIAGTAPQRTNRCRSQVWRSSRTAPQGLRLRVFASCLSLAKICVSLIFERFDSKR